MRFSWIAIGMLALPGAAMAAPKSAVERRYSPAYANCMNSGDAGRGVTKGMLDCNAAEIKLQDATLNQTYGAKMAKLSPARRTRLRFAERAWIKAKDKTCHDQAQAYAGGTLWSVSYQQCVLDETIKRTMVLERYR